MVVQFHRDRFDDSDPQLRQSLLLPSPIYASHRCKSALCHGDNGILDLLERRCGATDAYSHPSIYAPDVFRQLDGIPEPEIFV